jgi:hypothetical protein
MTTFPKQHGRHFVVKSRNLTSEYSNGVTEPQPLCLDSSDVTRGSEPLRPTTHLLERSKEHIRLLSAR